MVVMSNMRWDIFVKILVLCCWFIDVYTLDKYCHLLLQSVLSTNKYNQCKAVLYMLTVFCKDIYLIDL